MTKRPFLVAISVLALAVPAVAQAAPAAATPRFTPVKGAVDSKILPRSLQDDSKVNVIVEMAGEPVAVVEAQTPGELTTAQKKQIRSDLRVKQDAVAGKIRANGGRITGQMQSAYNGVAVTVSRNKVEALASLPGVVAVHAVQTQTRTNATAVPYLGVPGVWQKTGYTGKGVKVGIIDTGIDYTHADFGGPGTKAAYDAAKAAGTQAADPALFGPAAPRVKGGYDLVGDGYDATGEEGSPTPAPDPNPLDCTDAGHGTHVAGSAAGGGVTEAGAAYTGPYDSTTSTKSWKVGPGVAPQADLYAYRVFGCFGSTDMTTQAIDRAVADGMDVINMSLGSPFGVADDPSAIAARNAVGAGVVVVTSAGNSGPNPYLVGSPSTGGGVISVAAMDSTKSFPGATLTFQGGSTMAAINANGVSPLPTGPFQLVVLKDDPATGDVDESLGCSEAAYTFNGVGPGKNQLAASYRGDCARVAKAVFAQKAGAAAALMINNSAGYPPYEGPILNNPDGGAAYTVTIPFLGVRSSDEAALLAQAGKSVTLGAKELANPGYTGYASFSSGGPRTFDSGVRPSVTAPGVSISSAAVGTGTGSEFMSGTSMAAPMVAGVAALVVQARPTWSAQDVSAAVVTTAKSAKTAGYRLTLGGEGQVDPAAAVSTKSVLLGDSFKTAAGTFREPALSFGLGEFATTYRSTKYVYLKNNGTTSQKFSLSSKAAPQSKKGTVTISPRSVTVKAKTTAKVKVTLMVQPSAVPSSEGGGFQFYEVSGSILAKSSGGNLAIPYLLVPRVLSKATVASATPINATAASAKVQISNVSGGSSTSLDVYAWGISDKQDLPVNSITAGMDIRAVGVQSFPTDGLMVFAINNWTHYSNAALLDWDVSIDTNKDGQPEYVVFSYDYGAMTAGDYSGESVVFLYDVAKKTLEPQYQTVAPTDSSTVLLPIEIGALGLTSDAGTFSYRVESYTAADPTVTDETGWATYDPFAAPVVGEGLYTTVKAHQKATLTLPVNGSAYATLKPLGAMIVAFDNKAGADEALLVPGS